MAKRNTFDISRNNSGIILSIVCHLAYNCIRLRIEMNRKIAFSMQNNTSLSLLESQLMYKMATCWCRMTLILFHFKWNKYTVFVVLICQNIYPCRKLYKMFISVFIRSFLLTKHIWSQLRIWLKLQYNVKTALSANFIWCVIFNWMWHNGCSERTHWHDKYKVCIK